MVVGSLAVKNKNLIINLSNKNKEKIYVALDILDNKIMIKGWKKNSNLSVKDIFTVFNSSFVRGYILTDISRDGMLEGLDINFFKNLINNTQKNVIVGGGMSNYDDLNNLKNLNIINLEGVIAGKSFYSGNIKIDVALGLINSNA